MIDIHIYIDIRDDSRNIVEHIHYGGNDAVKRTILYLWRKYVPLLDKIFDVDYPR